MINFSSVHTKKAVVRILKIHRCQTIMTVTMTLRSVQTKRSKQKPECRKGDFFLYIKQLGNQACFLDMGRILFSWIPLTKQPSTCYRYSLLLSRPMLTTSLQPRLLSKMRQQRVFEALSIINPQWKSHHFMTDLCEEEINSIESIFPGKLSLLKNEQ